MKQVFKADEKEAYCRRKLNDLQKFGYPDLTLDEVKEQLEKIEKGEQLNVIGMFIKADMKP